MGERVSEGDPVEQDCWRNTPDGKSEIAVSMGAVFLMIPSQIRFALGQKNQRVAKGNFSCLAVD